jgi:S-adenosylmethionine synthetase
VVVLFWKDQVKGVRCHVILLNLVAAGVADEILVQVSYAIGLKQKTNIFIDTYG